VSRVYRTTRFVVGALTLSAAVPVAGLEWRDLTRQRDELQDQVTLLQDRVDAQESLLAESAGQAGPGPEVVSYGGDALPEPSAQDLAVASEEQLQLAVEAASLRRELARTRAEVASWERTEGTLDMSVAGPGRDPAARTGAASRELIDLQGEQDVLHRRLKAASRDLEEVQADRDEALAQLRREMFTNLVYSAIIGECGHRGTSHGVETCADHVWEQLRPRWDRFESCVQHYNAIPAYTQAASAQQVTNAVRLERGAVLMCDPRLPEGGGH